jgi:hypothetical protein
MLIAILTSLAALVGGLGIGYLDGHVTEVTVTLGLTLVVNLILAALAPRGAWRYPLISALAASTWIWMSASPDNPHFSRTFASYAALSLVLVMAAAAGAAIGAGLRKIPKIAG